MVAETLAGLVEERATIRNTLVATFLLVSLLGIANALLQTSAVLRPSPPCGAKFSTAGTAATR